MSRRSQHQDAHDLLKVSIPHDFSPHAFKKHCIRFFEDILQQSGSAAWFHGRAERYIQLVGPSSCLERSRVSLLKALSSATPPPCPSGELHQIGGTSIFIARDERDKDACAADALLEMLYPQILQIRDVAASLSSNDLLCYHAEEIANEFASFAESFGQDTPVGVPRWPELPEIAIFNSHFAHVVEETVREHLYGIWRLRNAKETSQEVWAATSLDEAKRIVGAAAYAASEIGNQESDHRNRPRATLQFHKGQFVIGFQRRKVTLKSSNRSVESRLIRYLYDADKCSWSLSYQGIYKGVYGDTCEGAGGAPSKLKTAVSRLNTRMIEQLGPAPDGQAWIRTNKGHGFYLNSSVTWQAAADWTSQPRPA